MAADAVRGALRRARGLVRRLANWRGASPVILMYHRVAEPGFDPWGLCVSPARFREHMAMLARHRVVLPLDDLVAALRAGNVPRFATAITFDDGYRDNLTAAAPILDEFGLPATLFASSGHIGAEKAFWWDELAQLVPERTRYHAEWRRLNALGESAREVALERLRAAVGAIPADRSALPMDRAMLRAAAQGPFAIGAHARTHIMLTALSLDDRAAQVAESRAELAAILGTPPAGFAYPHGAWDAATAAIVRDAGFAWAVTVENRAVPRRGFDCHALPRLTVGDWSAARLAREIRDAGG